MISFLTPSRDPSRGRRRLDAILLAAVSALAGGVVLIGSLSLAAVVRTERTALAARTAAPAATMAGTSPRVHHRADRPGDADPADAAAAAADLRRFAVNLLLLPLLDDDMPPRWTLAGVHQDCSDEPAVAVDGVPVVWERPVPPGSYVVRRELTSCHVFGDDRLAVAGSVTMTVFPDDDHGLTAIVQPHGVRIRSDSGAVVALDHAFVAREKQLVEPASPSLLETVAGRATQRTIE